MAEPNRKMDPVTNPVLVDAMATFKLDLTNREHEKAFLEAALEAKYLLPAKIEQLKDQATPDGQVPTRMAFSVLTNANGDKFMPAFTDEIELKKNRKGLENEPLQIAVVDFRALYSFIKQSEEIKGIVINPFGSALCLVRQQVLAIGENGFKIVVAPPKQQVFDLTTPPAPKPANVLGAPEDDSKARADMIRQAMADMEAAKDSEDTEEETADPLTDELLTAMKGSLKKQKAVKKAYIKAEKDNGERFLLVALESDASDSELEDIGNSVREDCADYTDLAFDFIKADSIRAKDLVAEEKPFYEKKRFGFF
ncbi:MAG: enhanced serine sensitivity protein SseB C-terminal domain-containing protein [Oscillospiraceae bacterium]|nr:enhanced serine sensitivity protein SseB C-terminal domain-containing protein [Oscillospiraceae bacterium]